MATTQIFTPFRADRLRVTRLNACGQPATGARGQVVTDGIISVDLKGNVDNGTAVLLKAANGSIKINEPGVANLTSITATITMTDVNPDIFEMVTGQTLITDGQGNPIGLAVSERSLGKVAVETWTHAAYEDATCDNKYGYFLLPFLVNGMIGDIMLNDGAMSAVLTGVTKRPSGWGTGPSTFLVADSSATSTPVAAVLATPIGITEHYRMFETPIAPPASTNGAVVL